METIKNAFNSVNKLGLLALVLVAFSTLAFTPSKRQDVTWKLVGSTWQTVPESQNYFCDGESEICTRLYPEGQNPNLNPTGYTDEDLGTFTIIPPAK